MITAFLASGLSVLWKIRGIALILILAVALLALFVELSVKGQSTKFARDNLYSQCIVEQIAPHGSDHEAWCRQWARLALQEINR